MRCFDRRWFGIVVFLAALVVAATAFGQSPAPSAPVAAVAPPVTTPLPPALRHGCKKLYTQRQHYRYARAVYGRVRVSRRAENRVLRMKRCQHSHEAEKNAGDARRALVRQRRQRQAVTPYGPWAIPHYIVMCESGGTNHPPNSAGASGYYQIIPGTWRGNGGLRFAPAAWLATKQEQDVIARRIWNSGGPGQWDCA